MGRSFADPGGRRRRSPHPGAPVQMGLWNIWSWMVDHLGRVYLLVPPQGSNTAQLEGGGEPADRAENSVESLAVLVTQACSFAKSFKTGMGVAEN